MILVEKISRSYENDGDKTQALKEVSFKINSGEFVAIMGPSGSGKSTLLHVLSFMDRASSGSYSFFGKKMEDMNDTELANVRNKEMGFVFQAFNLLGRSTVYQNVELPLIYSSVLPNNRKHLVEKAIADVGLSEKTYVEAGRLSGGQKQRVAIARALVNNPNVIFADEPTGNLDSHSGENIMQILKKLNEEGKTIILVTHETYTAQFAERLIRLKDGKIEVDGAVKDILSKTYESK